MRAVLRRHRAGMLVGLVVLIAIGASALVATRVETADPLDPDNPGRSGAQALARVLADRGVGVEIARGADALERATVDAHTTVVVTGTSMLGPSTLQRLLDHGHDGEIVLVEPDFHVVDDLDIDAEPRFLSPKGSLAASCGMTSVDGLRLRVDRTTAYPGAGCFPTEGDVVLLRPDRYAGRVLLWGAGRAFANDTILRGDNAAIALRLLGGQDRLVWYVPNPADLDASEGVGLGSLLPRWIGPGLWLALVTVLALVWWRGRRLGPLAREPLPVVVRAAETTEGLGRLYRRSGDRGHAADVLRRATLDRLATTLRLGTTAGRTDEQVVRAAAERAGRPVGDVARLLAPAVPPDDPALIALANDLAALEEEVRHP
jgi:hypothetical protein